MRLGFVAMTTDISFADRRSYIQLSEQRHAEIISASEKSWKPCVYALHACKYLAPLFVMLIGIGLAKVFKPLPNISAATFAVGWMVLTWFSPRVVGRITNPLAFRCIQAASMNYFFRTESSSSGPRLR
jgi:uncharacterized membrane protein